MCEYQITSKGVVIGEPLRGYRALTSGIPSPWSFESGRVFRQLGRHRKPPERSTENPME